MRIDTQLKQACHTLYANFQQKFLNSNDASYFVRYLDGAAAGACTLSSRIGLIAENKFKGIGNIVGRMLLLPNCSIRTGLFQLTVGVARNVCVLPFTVCVAIFKFAKGSPLLFVVTLVVLHRVRSIRNQAARTAQARAEQGEAERQIERQRHERIAAAERQRQEQIAAAAAAERAAESARKLKADEKVRFEALYIETEGKNSTDPNDWIALADLYETGTGTKKNLNQHRHCLGRAAGLGAPHVAFSLAHEYAKANEIEQARYYFSLVSRSVHPNIRLGADHHRRLIARAEERLIQLELEFPVSKVPLALGPEHEIAYEGNVTDRSFFTLLHASESSSAAASSSSDSVTSSLPCTGIYHPKAFELYTTLAQRGNLGAKVMVAFMYLAGVPVVEGGKTSIRQDYESAKKLLMEVYTHEIDPQSNRRVEEGILKNRSATLLYQFFDGVVPFNDETNAFTVGAFLKAFLGSTDAPPIPIPHVPSMRESSFFVEFTDFRYIKIF